MNERNKLRHFHSLDDLFDSNDNETIMEWVNKLAEKVEVQREQGKRYRKTQQLLVKAVMEHLDPAEVLELRKRAAE